ncbi:MAG: hypothetical protein AAFY36_05140 [Bacteroidota bacterium]
MIKFIGYCFIGSVILGSCIYGYTIFIFRNAEAESHQLWLDGVYIRTEVSGLVSDPSINENDRCVLGLIVRSLDSDNITLWVDRCELEDRVIEILEGDSLYKEPDGEKMYLYRDEQSWEIGIEYIR